MEECGAERKNIRTFIQLFATGLLGSHVVRRTADRMPRGTASRVRIHVLEQTKITNLDIAIDRQQQIVRFEVVMQDAIVVRVFQTFQRLAKPLQTKSNRHWSVCRDPPREVAARLILHGDPTEYAVARW